jgi:membrane protein
MAAPKPDLIPRLRAIAMDMWMFLRLFYQEIVRGDVLLRAPGLAYSTLASIVPILAILLAVLSTSAFKERQEEVFDALASKLVLTSDLNESWMPGDSDDFSQQDRYKDIFRENVKPVAEKMGAVGIGGGLALLVTAFLLFRTIEQAFNAIWRVQGERPFFTRLAITTSLIVWAPVLLVGSISLASHLQDWPILGGYIVPALFTTAAFTGFFMVMPYVRVRFFCALAGGALAAFVWELTKLLFLVYISRLVHYSEVYGTLGLLPMLLLWLYLNWVVILSGAAFACCLQQREALDREWEQRRRAAKASGGNGVGDCDPLAPPQPTLVLATAIAVAQLFRNPCPQGIRVSRLASALEVDFALAKSAAERLVAGGVLVRVAPVEGTPLSKSEDPGYVPACETSACKIPAVLLAAYTEAHAANGRNAVWVRASELADAFSKAGANGKFASVTLADLADGKKTPEHA